METHCEAILELLTGGNRRSIGRAAEALASVESEPALLECLVGGMSSTDPLISMRSADVAQKFEAAHPGALESFQVRLMDLAAVATQKEVRWHLAQLLPGLVHTREEMEVVFQILSLYLFDSSSIVRTFAMQGLADLALKDDSFIPRVLPILEECTRSGTPAMKSRGKKLIKRLNG